MLTLMLLYFLICTVRINILILFLYFFIRHLNKKFGTNNFQANVFAQKIKNLSENTVKTFFSDFKFPKYFRQKRRLLIMRNCFTYEISFSHFLIKTLQILRQVFIFHVFTCRSFTYFGSIVERDF